MGVNGTHSFLKKRGLSAQVLSSPMIESVNTVHVDLLGSYYQMVIDNFFLKVPNVAAKLIFTKLGHIFSVDRTILYLDGGRTKEKQETAERRRNVKKKDIRKLDVMFRVAEGKAAQGRLISASQYDALCRLSRRTFTLTDSMKKKLVQIAREEGWNMVACEGEADVHIGGLDLDETNVVISGDSDLLFYPRVQQVLRPMKDGSFHLYRKSNVTAVSNVTALQWTCVGIVSGNDYNRNIKGFGIATNCKLISKLKGDEIAQVIALYLKIDRVSDSIEGKVTFDNAIKVFGSQQQELLMRPLENQEEDIENSQQVLNSEFYKKRLLDLKRTYINTRKSMRAANRYELLTLFNLQVIS
jgi:hypothetical protein